MSLSKWLQSSTFPSPKSVRIHPSISTSNFCLVFLRVVGGEAPGSSLSQKVGPYGVPAKKVGEDIVKATGDYKSLRLTVKITIVNRVATIELCPGVATLVIKALKEPPRDRKKVKNIKHSGNLPLSEIVRIAKIAYSSRSLSSTLKNCVKEVLGTCSSIGCTVEGKKPQELTAEIDSGEVQIPM